jgi:hypothetical protein
MPDNRLMEGIWETREGSLLPISDIATSHILDCLARIRREWPGGQTTRTAFS